MSDAAMESRSTPKRVCVIAMDGSENADFAFKWYVDNVHKAGDHVVVVHTAEYPSVTGSSILMSATPGMIHSMTREEEIRIEKVLNNINDQIKASGISVGGKVIRLGGHAGESIVKAAVDEHADLIVTGTRGMGTLRRTLLGSVSDYIIHHSSVPVIICRHPDHHHDKK